MKFVGCSLHGELWEDDKNIYLKPYIDTDIEHHAWAGEESDSHREVGETQFLSVRSDTFRTEFTCGACGHEWNVLNQKPDVDRCHECGKLVSRNKHRKRIK